MDSYLKLPFGMYLAKKMFRKLGWKRKQMVAAYVSGGRFIVRSNAFKTHPSSRAKHQRIHAEHAALRHIEEGSGKLYVYRETADGNPAMARPCPACIELIRSKGIRVVYYSTNNGFAKEIFQ